ncbi:hypothetical protein GCM10020216_064540 [Nonomuraea helvata]
MLGAAAARAHPRRLGPFRCRRTASRSSSYVGGAAADADMEGLRRQMRCGAAGEWLQRRRFRGARHEHGGRDAVRAVRMARVTQCQA